MMVSSHVLLTYPFHHLYPGYSIIHSSIPQYIVMVGTNILDFVLRITAHSANLQTLMQKTVCICI